MRKKAFLISAIAILLTAVMVLVFWLIGGRDKKSDDQDPSKSVYSPQTIVKTLEEGGINTDDRFGEFKQ